METNKKELKANSHKLKPVVIIGSQGLTDNVQKEIATALEAHELIKIRINARDDEARQAMTQAILDEHDATLVNQIGHIAVIYRSKVNNP